ncbi:MAG: prepilin-type N-terminal cleavage/methylation domain-containing protein [Gemmatimonadota bacterium]|nr:prepilin-type N-terminal cleavage/methylation domain-containing protein [Gemmatimonadota bacterium]
MPHRRAGFTLIELLIVIVIIGILAAIAIPKFSNTKAKAYEASMQSDLRNLAAAMEAYYVDNNSTYPSAISDFGTSFQASSGVTVVLGGVTTSSWRATATNAFTPKRCKLASGTTRAYDAQVTCY